MATREQRTVNAEQAEKLIRVAMQVKRPVFLWGPPGIGKSDLIEGIGKSTGRPVIDMRMLLLDPTDVKGIPYYNPAKNAMEWAPPGELPTVVTEKDLTEADARISY